jgi:hypothetical protein
LLTGPGLLALSVVGVVFFFSEQPDGSESALEQVQLGMNRAQVEAALAFTP